MVILSPQNDVIKGAVPVNSAISGEKIIEELKKVGTIINIEEN
jgi:hypothetical protein